MTPVTATLDLASPSVATEGSTTLEVTKLNIDEGYTLYPFDMATDTSKIDASKNVFIKGRIGLPLRDWSLRTLNRFETKRRQFPVHSSYEGVLDLGDSLSGEAIREWEKFCEKMRKDDEKDPSREILRESWVSYKCAMHKQRMHHTSTAMPERPAIAEPNLVKEFCEVLKKRFPLNQAQNLHGLTTFKRLPNETASELYYRLIDLAEGCPSYDKLKLQSMYLRQLPDNIRRVVTDYWLVETNKAKTEGTTLPTLENLQCTATDYETLMEERNALDPVTKHEQKVDVNVGTENQQGNIKV